MFTGGGGGSDSHHFKEVLAICIVLTVNHKCWRDCFRHLDKRLNTETVTSAATLEIAVGVALWKQPDMGVIRRCLQSLDTEVQVSENSAFIEKCKKKNKRIFFPSPDKHSYCRRDRPCRLILREAGMHATPLQNILKITVQNKAI